MTQAVCDVCAVSYDDVVAVAATLPSRPRVLSLDPLTLDEVLADIVRARRGGRARPRRRGCCATQARRRIEAVARAVAGAPRPRVAAIEWLDPPFIAGHWVPEMIRLAGGEDVLGRAGERSRTAEWEEIAAARAGGRARDAVRLRRGALGRGGARRSPTRSPRSARDRVVAVDASAYFSRPGPAAGDRHRAARPHPAPRPGAGAGRRDARRARRESGAGGGT